MKLNQPNELEEMLMRAMEYAFNTGVTGDYLEFGVEAGKSFLFAHRWAKHIGNPAMKFYAFDSFQGLPLSCGEFQEQSHRCSRKQFEKNIKRAMKDTVIVESWYADLKPEDYRGGAAVVMLDCDLYESTRDALSFLTPHVQQGTVMIFDDWFCFKGDPKDGQQRAAREWSEKTGISLAPYHPYTSHGHSFIATTP